MSDDPFEDLGRADGRSPGERLAERDRTHPEVRKGPPEVPRPGNKYAWLVGILMVMGLGVLLFTTTLPHAGEGVEGPRVGQRLPAFAAPLTTGTFAGDADANVCQHKPCNENAGQQPACDVHGREILTVCRRDKQPLVLTFVVTRGADCEPQVDRVERMKDDFPGVMVAVVMSGNSVDDSAQIAGNRRWTQPVGVDHDGAVVNLYGVGVCPVTVFAKDGRVKSVGLGNLTEAQLRARTRRLIG
ncbi:MAG TPA: hypothetical protein VI111_03915 [Thermoleophilaceae bacterium]